MPLENHNLHGDAPDKAAVALLLIDVINDLEFREGAQLLSSLCPWPVAWRDSNSAPGRTASQQRVNDMRDLAILTPPDCIVSNIREENHNALDQMVKLLKSDASNSAGSDLKALQ
jgi:hypothetical protein